ncbi:MAG: hypothetical protein HRS50_01510 [Mycoplasmataceae bacterium]|nr:hypothetical protein [Mycoplasmataceae bacterium]
MIIIKKLKEEKKMGIKDILYTEKGKIGSGILATALISTVVLIPMSIFIDRFINSSINNVILAYGFDGSVSSTGSRQNSWMGISGESNLDKESTLINTNNGYVSVDTAEKMIDGVKKTDGISYLSYLSILKLNSNGSVFTGLKITEDRGKTWISPDNKEGNYIKAPLNMIMKVPDFVADILREYMAGNDNIPINDVLTIDKFNISDDSINYGTIGKYIDSQEPVEVVVNTDYGDFLKEGYWDDFRLSFALFNYIIYSETAHTALDKFGLTPGISNSETLMNNEEYKNWLFKVFGDKAFNDIEPTNEFIDLLIDGSGTNEGALNILINSFNENVLELGFNPKLKLNQLLENSGSYGAWETSILKELPPGVVFNKDEYDGSQSGRRGTFLGTQSRGVKQRKLDFDDIQILNEHDKNKDGTLNSADANGEISYWGYNEEDYTNIAGNITGDDFIYNQNYMTESMKSNSNLPLGVTMATDNIVFFTTSNLQVMNYNTMILDHPEGISKEGYKMIYQFGTTWDVLSKNGHIHWGV